MFEWLQIFLTASLTLIGGILLLITSEFVKLLIVIPLKKYRDHIEFIIDRLDFHANLITNYFSEDPSPEEKELMQQIRKDFRSAATQLNAIYSSVTLKRLFVKFRLLPARKDIMEAYSNLILLSNNLPKVSRVHGSRDPIDVNDDAIKKIKAALNPSALNQ